VSASNAKESAVVRHNCSAKLRNVGFKVDQVLRLLERNHIVEVNVLIAPLEVVYNAFVSQLLLDNKQVLEKLNNPLVDVEVIELCNHCFLIL
jgi:hypothetical protein